MHKILVPLDGSKNALRALEVGISVAKRRTGSRVHLLNVQPLPEQYGMVLAYLDQKQHRKLREERSNDVLVPAITRLYGQRTCGSSRIWVWCRRLH